MAVPQEPLTLSPEEVLELDRQLSDTRHNINNHLTLISTALELMRRKPESTARMLENMADQPQRIRDEITRLSSVFERVLRITKG